MTRVLVTGVTGQDGTLLSRRLLAEGHEVHGLALSGDRLLEWAVDGLEAVTLHVGDLADAARVGQVVTGVQLKKLTPKGSVP